MLKKFYFGAFVPLEKKVKKQKKNKISYFFFLTTIRILAVVYAACNCCMWPLCFSYQQPSLRSVAIASLHLKIEL